MSDDVRAALAGYFRAGLAGDIGVLEQIYAPGFHNIRLTPHSQIDLSRTDLLTALRQRFAAGGSLPPIDDVEVLDAVEVGDSGTILFRRIKDGKLHTYVFLWDLSTTHPTLIREFTVLN